MYPHFYLGRTQYKKRLKGTRADTALVVTAEIHHRGVFPQGRKVQRESAKWQRAKGNACRRFALQEQSQFKKKKKSQRSFRRCTLKRLYGCVLNCRHLQPKFNIKGAGLLPHSKKVVGSKHTEEFLISSSAACWVKRGGSPCRKSGSRKWMLEAHQCLAVETLWEHIQVLVRWD